MRSRSPPQPNRVMTRLFVSAARDGDRIAKRVIRMRVIHDHQKRLAYAAHAQSGRVPRVHCAMPRAITSGPIPTV